MTPPILVIINDIESNFRASHLSAMNPPKKYDTRAVTP